MNSERKTVFITGATDGIGLSLARRYHERECRLILVGRKPLQSLNDPFFTKDTYCQADLAEDGLPDIVLHFLQRNQVERLDICIQNAGTSYYGPMSDQTAESIRNVVAVNLTAPIHLSRVLFPFLGDARGKLVFISSVASYLPCPKYAVYGATKSALNGFARSLRVETKGRIRVQVIYPGATRTGMHRKAGIRDSDLDTDRFPSADRVAFHITRIIDSNRAEAVVGQGNTLSVWLGRYLSVPLEAIMRRWNK